MSTAAAASRSLLEGLFFHFVSVLIWRRIPLGGSVGHRYNTALKGFSATLTPENFHNLQGDSIIVSHDPVLLRKRQYM